MPRVSVVLPTYRRPHMIAASLRTVVAQTWVDTEILVKADGVSDETEQVVASFADARIRFSRSDSRLGIPGIVNALIAETVGEYVIVLHDHDLYKPTFIARLVALLEAHPTALFAHPAVDTIDENGRITGVYQRDYPDLTPGEVWLRFMLSRFDSPVCALSLVRRSAYEQHGLYDAAYGFLADVEMWLRLSTQGDVAYLREVLVSLREREADHAYARTNWQAVDALLRMHREYTARVLPGRTHAFKLACRTEQYLMMCYLAAVKRSRGDHAARSAARAYLRGNGRLISRSLAAII